MKDERLLLLSAEKQFLLRDSFNRGFVQMPRMITACIGLSLQAKGIYNFIANYVYEQGKSAFPSIHRIAIGTGITGKSVVKYIDELVDRGFIIKIRRGRGMTNDYYIVDVDKVRLLHVSEMLWMALNSVQQRSKGKSWDDIYVAWEAILNGLRELKFSVHDLDCSEDSKNKLEEDLIALLEGKKPTMSFVPKNPKNKTRTAVPSIPAPQNVTYGQVKSSYLDQPEDTWSVSNFINYFYDKFFETTGLKHSVSKGKHAGIMQRVLKQMDGDSKSELRKYIDAFFNIGYEIKTIEWFGTSCRVGEIRAFLTDGTKPFYLNDKQKIKQKEVKEAKQQNQGLSLDALDKLLGGDQNE
ncbi:helix-turn-helix domain-containing protein [Brevibacillus laterosporus]|uniref:helix-turn-helix domain-containing protein n=1 Tax=Brevibacillus laterosporus TaxID=1465 RepID=UPI003D22CEAF